MPDWGMVGAFYVSTQQRPCCYLSQTPAEQPEGEAVAQTLLLQVLRKVAQGKTVAQNGGKSLLLFRMN